MKKILKYFSIVLLLIVLAIWLSISWTTQHFIENRTSETGKKIIEKPDTTEVFVLGTIHESGGSITYDSLYNLLERIKPDIILFERDSSAFDANMNFKTTLRSSFVFPDFIKKYQPSNLEQIAVRKYLHFNPTAIVRPYEWSERDRFHKKYGILTKGDEVFEAIDHLDQTNKLTKTQQEILHTYYSLTEQANSFGDSTLYEINSTFQDSITGLRQYFQYQKIKSIVDEKTLLAQYRDFYKINESYWDIRNKAMSDNILRYIKLFQHNRIVVLNGYFHRYYLRSELQKKQTEYNFILKDIEK